MHPERIFIKDFTYELPEERIAKYPLPVRDQSKLLIYKEGQIKEDVYLHLDGYLPSDTLLVFNNTKVVEARLIFQKSTGSAIELFCLEPADEYPDITTAMMQQDKVLWKCLVGGAKKWKDELLVKVIDTRNDMHTEFILTAKKIKRLTDDFLIEFSWNKPSLSFAEVLHHAGDMPLPPYLNRAAEESDRERYQTIYAKCEGSVAAPTAGLHFTERLFQKLEQKNIQRAFVTLHVGAGTFKPVKTETIGAHEMHSEFFEAKKELIEDLLQHLDKKIVAVGTTSLRTIESLYWLGVKTIHQPDIPAHDLQLQQWEIYNRDTTDISAREALNALLTWMQRNQNEMLVTKTQIIIVPGYAFKIAAGLITNFHQPQSTLLLLVAAIAGRDWKKIYDYALERNYRFLSYGDGCLIWKRQELPLYNDCDILG